METGLEGKTVLVTGAAGRIGSACCAVFGAEGAQVVCADVDGQAAAMTALMLGGTPAAGDVTRPADAERIVEEALSLTGSLDIVVTSHGAFDSTPVSEIEPDDWDRVQAVNLRGTFLVCRTALKTMAGYRRGAIVTIGSLAGRVGSLHAGASYAASNAGVVALTKSLAREAGPLGIRANCVQPGFIATPRTETLSDESRQEIIGRTPLGRIGEPEEVAAAVVWLASDRASFINGAHIDVSGGLHMD
jgi:NAD(P)-dependent dehydrogenase (short-subunit alcohol dehydrogenase family)